MADPLSPAVLPHILKRFVPQAIIYSAVDAVLPAEIVGDDRRFFIARLSPDALNDPTVQMQALVKELTRRGLVDEFARTLVRSLPFDQRLHDIFSLRISVDEDGTPNSAQLQSLNKSREPFLNTKLFGDFMVSTRYRVCAIWISSPECEGRMHGTGFLIAPDLVLTARHVLDDALTRELPQDPDQPKQGAVIKCVFDYWRPIHQDVINQNERNGITVVDVAREWLVWSSDKHPDDGIGRKFERPPDIFDLHDAAIVRLSKRIGAEAIETGGGRMRGWVKLLAQKKNLLRKGDTIAILQHPAGGPQGLGSGRFEGQHDSATRLFYTTDAVGGSSGAPCFDSEATLVGFHNAGALHGVEDTYRWNQGVSISAVIGTLARVDARTNGVFQETQIGLPDEMALWSLSDDQHKPVPVLGRLEFKSAVLSLFDPNPKKRVIVVQEAPDAPPFGKSGKSFSTRILQAIARDRPALVLEFSASELERLSPLEFLSEICCRIGVPDADWPAAPTDERQITRWWANDLPDRFGALLEERALPTGTAVRENAKITEGAATVRETVLKDLVWIVIDDIHRWPPARGMKELIAGMMAVTDTQTGLRPGLRALRWLVIGHVPDFIRDQSIDYIFDVVSPLAIGAKEWGDCLFSYFVSAGQPERFNTLVAEALYNFSMNKLATDIGPETRLSFMAATVPDVIRFFPQVARVP